MTDDEWRLGLAEGLQAWIKDADVEHKIEGIKKTQERIEKLQLSLEAERKGLQTRLDHLPPGMAGALGFPEKTVTIMPHCYFWAKKYNVSVAEAKKLLVDSMTRCGTFKDV